MQPTPFGRKAPASFAQTATVQNIRSSLMAPRAVAPAGGRDTAFAFLFSPRGRVSRRTFRLARIGFVAGYLCVYGASQLCVAEAKAAAAGTNPTAGLLCILAELVALLLALGVISWCSTIVAIKRWHDLDKSGLWVLSAFVPLAGWVWEAIMCGFTKGTDGPNRFGPEVA